MQAILELKMRRDSLPGCTHQPLTILHFKIRSIAHDPLNAYTCDRPIRINYCLSIRMSVSGVKFAL